MTVTSAPLPKVHVYLRKRKRKHILEKVRRHRNTHIRGKKKLIDRLPRSNANDISTLDYEKKKLRFTPVTAYWVTYRSKGASAHDNNTVVHASI